MIDKESKKNVLRRPWVVAPSQEIIVVPQAQKSPVLLVGTVSFGAVIAVLLFAATMFYPKLSNKSFNGQQRAAIDRIEAFSPDAYLLQEYGDTVAIPYLCAYLKRGDALFKPDRFGKSDFWNPIEFERQNLYNMRTDKPLIARLSVDDLTAARHAWNIADAKAEELRVKTKQLYDKSLDAIYSIPGAFDGLTELERRNRFMKLFCN